MKVQKLEGEIEQRVEAERKKWTDLYHDKSGVVLDLNAIIEKACEQRVAQAREQAIEECAKWMREKEYAEDGFPIRERHGLAQQLRRALAPESAKKGGDTDARKQD